MQLLSKLWLKRREGKNFLKNPSYFVEARDMPT